MAGFGVLTVLTLDYIFFLLKLELHFRLLMSCIELRSYMLLCEFYENNLEEN